MFLGVGYHGGGFGDVQKCRCYECGNALVRLMFNDLLMSIGGIKKGDRLTDSIYGLREDEIPLDSVFAVDVESGSRQGKAHGTDHAGDRDSYHANNWTAKHGNQDRRRVLCSGSYIGCIRGCQTSSSERTDCY